MNRLNQILLLICLVLLGQIAYAKNTKVAVRKIELINDCKEVMISFNIDGKDTITIDKVQLAVDGQPVDATFTGNLGICFHNGICKKVIGTINNINGNLLAWQPADVEISYTAGTSNAKSYYSTHKLRYKKPIEERRSYFSITEGGMKFFGHNKTEYANVLSGAPWAIQGELEFGKKIRENTFLTIASSVQEISSSNRLNSLLLGGKYEKSTGKKVFFGQAQAGLCSSVLYYRPLDASQDFDNERYRNIGSSFIYGAQIGVGYSLSKSTRLFLKSNILHTNVSVNNIPQSITGIGINGGISFYFNNRKN